MKLTRLFAASAFAVGALLTCASGYAADAYHESGRADGGWSAYSWPMTKADQPGELFERLKKYDAATGKKAEEWQRKNHFGSDILGWWGYCHGFAASAIMESEPTGSVEYMGQTFTVGDQKALLALSHAGDIVNMFGQRYNDGDEESKFKDISPAMLLSKLRLFLQKNKAPLAVDLKTGAEVENVPVVAYEATYTIDGDVCNGKLKLTMAKATDDKDYVGVKTYDREYEFQITVVDGLLALDQSKWIGKSEKDHPDFAWYPFVIRPESPEIDYNIVRQICNAKPVTPPFIPPTPQYPEVVLGDAALDLPTAFELLRDKKADWTFDVSVDQFDGGYYPIGGEYAVTGRSQNSGYLYLVGYYVDVEKGPTVYTVETNDGKGFEVEADKNFKIEMTAALENRGEYRIRALVTAKPLTISLPERAQAQTQAQEASKTLIPPGLRGANNVQQQQAPTQPQQAQDQQQQTPVQQQQSPIQQQMQVQAQSETLQASPNDALASALVEATGGFSQDQVAFVVVTQEDLEKLRNNKKNDDNK